MQRRRGEIPAVFARCQRMLYSGERIIKNCHCSKSVSLLVKQSSN